VWNWKAWPGGMGWRRSDRGSFFGTISTISHDYVRLMRVGAVEGLGGGIDDSCRNNASGPAVAGSFHSAFRLALRAHLRCVVSLRSARSARLMIWRSGVADEIVVEMGALVVFESKGGAKRQKSLIRFY
jgi:hypothetical protein